MSAVERHPFRTSFLLLLLVVLRAAGVVLASGAGRPPGGLAGVTGIMLALNGLAASTASKPTARPLTVLRVRIYLAR